MEFTGVMFIFIAIISGVLALIGMKHETVFIGITLVFGLSGYLCFCQLDHKQRTH
jgi:hypothetical protein